MLKKRAIVLQNIAFKGKTGLHIVTIAIRTKTVGATTKNKVRKHVE